MEKMIPKVSIILTVLNEQATLLALLEVLRKQTVTASEIIIADGGSTDQTPEFIEHYRHKYPQLHLQLISKKGNRSVGRNAAIKVAQGEWIAITDAGCIPHPDWLAQLMLTAQQMNHKEFVVAGYYDAQANTPFQQAVVPYVLVMPDKVNPNSFLPATRSMLISKSAWKKVGGFDEHLSDNEDYAFAHALKQHGVEFGFNRKAIVTWIPRSNLQQFGWMIFRFARGDAQAQIWRSKVLLIFGRYTALLLVIMIWLILQRPIFLLLIFLFIGLVSYSFWAIQKNRHYLADGWYWLPVLQITSDLAVMSGTVVGFFSSH